MWLCKCDFEVNESLDACPNCGRLRDGSLPGGSIGDALLTVGQLACVIGCLWAVGAFFVGLGGGVGLLVVGSVISFLWSAALYVVFGRVKNIR